MNEIQDQTATVALLFSPASTAVVSSCVSMGRSTFGFFQSVGESVACDDNMVPAALAVFGCATVGCVGVGAGVAASSFGASTFWAAVTGCAASVACCIPIAASQVLDHRSPDPAAMSMNMSRD